MTDLIDAAKIEEIVDRPRHASTHIGLANSAEGKVYILHSRACLQYSKDLRECRYSKALSRGIDLADWKAWEDQPVSLCVVNGQLLPINVRRNQHNQKAETPAAPRWEIHRMVGFNINSPWVATTPGCPTGRHPHRWCQCKVFPSRQGAEDYITEQTK